MKKLKEGRIYRIGESVSMFRGHQGGAFIFTSLNRAARGRYANYSSQNPKCPLKNPKNWGKMTEHGLEEVSFWPSLYWRFKALLGLIKTL